MHRTMPISEFPLWKKTRKQNTPIQLSLELTARCNCNCLHCYINLPARDAAARAEELSFQQICHIIDQAADMGALWCLLTGGEPLLREDFSEIYMYLKKKGFLVIVFTNATLVRPDHVRMFTKYPPRNLEVTVYGERAETYERITRMRGSFQQFEMGLNRLLESGLPLKLKTMALRSNFHDLDRIARFCTNKSTGGYRFDPFLHLRHDRDPDRNLEIIAERLTPEEIVLLESADPTRFETLQRFCDVLMQPESPMLKSGHLFGCGIGQHEIVVSPSGWARPCRSLCHPDFTFDTKQQPLGAIREKMQERIGNAVAKNPEFRERCGQCKIINLCIWCPAVGYLETGELDAGTEEFCRLARARENMLREGSEKMVDRQD